MYDTTPERPSRRIDPDHYEHSPSTGYEAIAEILHAPDAHSVEPPDTTPDVCGAYGCHVDDGLLQVTTPTAERVLCPDHARDFIEVTA